MSAPNMETVSAAMEEAKTFNNRIGRYADWLAELLYENLRRTGGYNLKRLKRALRNYDSVRGRWRD